MAITTKTGRTMNITPKNILAPTTPVVQSPTPVQQPTVAGYTPGTSIDNRPVATKSGNEYIAYSQRNNPTLATRDNPMIAVSTKPQQIDLGTADMNTLLKEQDAINYKISTGAFTQDDFVRGREISRKLAESMYKSNEQVSNPYLTELENKAQEVSARDISSPLDLKRQQLQANLDSRKAMLQESAKRARESTIGNIAMSGGGRSSVAQQAELDIQRQLENQLMSEQKAMELELMAYQAELEGAKSEDLKGLYSQIDELKGQAAKSQMSLEQQRQEKILEATSKFDSNLQSLAKVSGIQLDPQDEKAVEQMITIARNPDGTPNEEFIKTLAPQYQTLVRVGVGSSIGKSSFTPKVERLGGTTKNPIYGYRDPNKQAFVSTNAMGVPTGGTVRMGGGGASGGSSGSGGTGVVQQGGSNALDLVDYNVKFKNQDQSNAFSYATRMIEASDVFNQTEQDIAGLSKSQYILQKSYGKLPYGSSLQSETVQKQSQAEQNFINAVLRRESGAAIAANEYNNAEKQYFPQPGDSPSVLEQKRKNRLTALKGISAATGNQKSLAPAINVISQKKSAPSQMPVTQQKPKASKGGRGL